LDHWLFSISGIWSAELGTNIVCSSHSLIAYKSFQGVVCAILDADKVLNESGGIDGRIYGWHVEDTLASIDFDLHQVSIAHSGFTVPYNTGTVMFMHCFAAAEASKPAPRSTEMRAMSEGARSIKVTRWIEMKGDTRLRLKYNGVVNIYQKHWSSHKR
jgi:hypothetical protein